MFRVPSIEPNCFATYKNLNVLLIYGFDMEHKYLRQYGYLASIYLISPSNKPSYYRSAHFTPPRENILAYGANFPNWTVYN